MVGFGLLDFGKDGVRQTATLAEAYVLPDYRRHGKYGRPLDIYDRLIEEREKIAWQCGVTEMVTYPAQDGRAKKTLIKHGYLVTEVYKDGSEVMRKILTYPDPELQNSVSRV